MPTELEKRFFSGFSPEAPSHSDLKNYYVNLDSGRGGSIVNGLKRALEMADPAAPLCRLLSGHKGSGKTVELMRLKDQLEKDRQFTVIHWLAEETIDLIAVDFPDLLLGLVTGIATALRDAPYHIELSPGYFAKLPTRLKSILQTEVEFGEISLGTDMATLTGTLKQSPDMRAKVRQALEPESQSLLTATNDVLTEAKKKLKAKGFSDNIVLLVDDLDKGGWERHPTAGVTMGHYLFVNRFAQLTGFNCHVVYTLPLDLAYGIISGTLQNRYGKVPVLPMVEVRKRPPNEAINQTGIALMRELVKRRLTSIGIHDESNAFNPDVLDKLIAASGGEPRQLLHLIREALLQGSLPIDGEAAERSIKEAQQTLRRSMTMPHWDIVREVAKNGVLSITPENAAYVRDLLFNRHILQYRNGEEWFAPSPLLGKPPVS